MMYACTYIYVYYIILYTLLPAGLCMYIYYYYYYIFGVILLLPFSVFFFFFIRHINHE